MSYTNTKQMLLNARKKGFCVGAFNMANVEQAQAITEVATELKKDVIIQASESTCKHIGMETIVSIVKNLAENSPVSIALHLDHGKSVEVCKKAIDCGFSSVMIDLSGKSFDENILGTKEVVEYAKKHNVSVEAELGEIIGVEDEQSSSVDHLTDPKKAREFVEKTGIDSLAISIGTAHGINKGITEPKIRFDIVKKIEKELPNFPLVCHGASTVEKHLTEKIVKFGGVIKKSQGIPSSTLARLAKTGISKINIDTDLKLSFMGAIREFMNNNPDVFDIRKIMAYAKEQCKDYLRNIITNILN